MSKYDEDEIQWSDDEKLFDSPIPPKTSSSKDTTSANANGKTVEGSAQTQQVKARQPHSQLDAEEAREAALQQELENVRKINTVIEGVVESLEKARGNMENVSRTVTSASTLLQTWSRILSQTEHNQRLILNPAWRGATQDLADIDAEEAQRARDAQRRQVEEAARREAAARKAEDDERRRAEAAARGTRGARGRGVARGRVASSGYGQRPGSGAGRGSTPGTSSRTGTGSGVGRGVRGTRGRA